VHELIIWIVFDVLQIFQVTGVGQSIEVDDPVLRVFSQLVADEVGTYEAGTAGD